MGTDATKNDKKMLDELRERGALEGRLQEWLSQQVWDERYPLSLGGFRPLDSEECKKFGYGEDDGTVLLCRETDGVVFEIDIDVTARKTSHVVRED